MEKRERERARERDREIEACSVSNIIPQRGVMSRLKRDQCNGYGRLTEADVLEIEVISLRRHRSPRKEPKL